MRGAKRVCARWILELCDTRYTYSIVCLSIISLPNQSTPTLLNTYPRFSNRPRGLIRHVFWFTCIATCAFFPTAEAQTLSPGDIAVIGVNADNPDHFGFVALVDLPAGTVVGFTDHGWQSSGSFRSNEDVYSYTASGSVSAGTVIEVVSGAPQFSGSGDQLIVFQGSVVSPTLIYAINFEGTGWQASATSSRTSALPSGLTNGSTAVAIGECDNMAYTGSTSGSQSELLLLIGDASNWNCNDSTRQTFATSFTVSSSSNNNIPTFVTSTSAATFVAGDQVSLSYEATDADSEPITFGGISLPAGAAVDASSGILTWVPTEDQVGTHTFSITASDGKDTAALSVTITITSAIESRRPQYVGILPRGTVAQAGDDLQEFHLFVQDPDGGSLSYSIEPSNLGATVVEGTIFGSTYPILEWTTPQTPGIQRFDVTFTDDEGLSLSLDFYVAGMGALFPGESGDALMASLVGTYSPARTLGYSVARDTLYAIVDRNAEGKVAGIYTGFEVAYLGGDPSTELFSGGINAEHTWPQSMGAGDEPQKSDMHFVFPSKINVNAERGSFPFAEIPDDQTSSWFRKDEISTSIPATNIDEYSEYVSGRFEPRESVKGDVARAVFYFNTIYSGAANTSFFNGQKAILGKWNAVDAPSNKEIARSGMIQTYQGNINPFLLDPSLPNRLFGLSVSAEEESVPVELQVGNLFPNPASKTVSITIQGIPSAVRVAVYDVLGRATGSFMASEGLNTLDISHLAPGIYSVQIQTEHAPQTLTLIKTK